MDAYHIQSMMIVRHVINCDLIFVFYYISIDVKVSICTTKEDMACVDKSLKRSNTANCLR